MLNEINHTQEYRYRLHVWNTPVSLLNMYMYLSAHKLRFCRGGWGSLEQCLTVILLFNKLKAFITNDISKLWFTETRTASPMSSCFCVLLNYKMNSKSGCKQRPWWQHSKLNRVDQTPGLWCSLEKWLCCSTLGLSPGCPVWLYKSNLLVSHSLLSDCLYVSKQIIKNFKTWDELSETCGSFYVVWHI